MNDRKTVASAGSLARRVSLAAITLASGVGAAQAQSLQSELFGPRVYETQRVTRVPDLPVRLPRHEDLLPPLLAERVLDGARPDELGRLPTRRVAGRLAVGIRLTPGSAQSTIGSR